MTLHVIAIISIQMTPCSHSIHYHRATNQSSSYMTRLLLPAGCYETFFMAALCRSVDH